METFNSLLLEIWREAARHIRIDESMSRIALVLAQRLPLGVALVRRFDPGRSEVETVATAVTASLASEPEARSACDPSQMHALLAWCAQRKILRGAAQTIAALHPGLLPARLDCDVLAAGLMGSTGPIGALVLCALPGQRFESGHEPMLAALLDPVSAALENDRQLRELSSLREAAEADRDSLLKRLGRQDIADTIVGADSGLRDVMERVELVARADAPVLIFGETGTGKEVVARAIHMRSGRSQGPFLRVNCGAIPPELIDSELFGHERGSFTGAVAQRKGWFERADGGTLFLDEIGELSLAAQVRLLRILQDGSLQRVGGQQTISVDVRLVAATHRDLQGMMGRGEFRADLWYRIAVFPIYLPPLRDRVQDIPAMASHFALRAARKLGLAPQLPSAEDLPLLAAYGWPGNVRELAAVMDRAAILGDGRRLEIARALGAGAPARSPRPDAAANAQSAAPWESLDSAMQRHIERTLQQARGRIEGPFGAARMLGINPHTLRARMRKLGINWQRYRRAAG